MQTQSEEQQVSDEKPVADGDESYPWQACDECRERRIDGDHTEKRAGEPPLKLFHASGNAHLVADWAQNVIGKKDAEDIKPRPAECAYFRGLDVDHRPKQTVAQATR